MQCIKLKYHAENLSDMQIIDQYQKEYNSAYRVYYNLMLDDLCKNGELRSLFDYYKILRNSLDGLKNLDLMKKTEWLRHCAIKEAHQLISKTRSQRVIFGGRKNFIRRQKGLISKEEYKENRLRPLYSEGTAKPYKGNQKFEIDQSLEFVVFKPTRDCHIKLYLEGVGSRSQLLMRLFMKQEEKSSPISYKIDKNYVWIMFDEKIVNEQFRFDPIENRILAIDLNPNYLGLSIVDWHSSSSFSVIKTMTFSLKHLNDKDFALKNKGFSSSSKERQHITNKRHHEQFEIVKKIISTALYYKCQIIAIEDLNIDSCDKHKGHKFNRLCNNIWNRGIFTNNLVKRCNIYHLKLVKIKPEYSSFIGNFLYRNLSPKMPDPILASIEIGRRGYEFYNQFKSKTKKKEKNIIQPKVEHFERFRSKSLEEFSLNDEGWDFIKLFYVFKKSKMLYRLSFEECDINIQKFSSKFSSVEIWTTE